MSDVLSVAELINVRGMKVDVRCYVCGEEFEIINYVFFICYVVR